MSRPPTSMEWLAWQVLRPMQAQPPKPINPKPAGQPCQGGAAEAVLLWLEHRPSRGAWWSMHQIIRGTGRTAKACCWAVIYLHRIGTIERERDVGNSRYLRYRVSTRARDEFSQV